MLRRVGPDWKGEAAETARPANHRKQTVDLRRSNDQLPLNAARRRRQNNEEHTKEKLPQEHSKLKNALGLTSSKTRGNRKCHQQ